MSGAPPRHAYAALDVAAFEVSDQESELSSSSTAASRDSVWSTHGLVIGWSAVGVLLVTTIVLAVVCSVPHKGHTNSLLGPTPEDLLRKVVNPVPQLDHDFRGKPRQISSEHGMVAADNSRCSDIGATALQEGGNAVDAAVATALCLGVVNPFASGIGGGAFITIYLPNGTAEVINAREPAPAAANTTMYTGHPGASLDGGLAIAVPVELKGLHLAWQRHGALPWRRLVEPAAVLADAGYAAHPYFIWVTSGPFTQARMRKTPLLREAFMVPDHTATDGWRSPFVGEHCCRRPRLAQTLRRIAQEGPEWLYSGAVVERLAEEIQAAGGIVTADDLRAVQPRLEAPLRASLGEGIEIISPQPPSSAAAVITALKIMEGFTAPADRNSAHYAVEAMKHAFALRLALGDPGTPEQPQWNVKAVLHDMLNDTFVNSLREVLSPDHVLDSTSYGGKWNPGVNATLDDHGTSHLCVVDASGAAVSITSSINTVFGSGVVSPSTGVVFNNQMDDFSRPDSANTYHLAPSRANFIQPGKRPLSSMSPSVVVKDGKVRMVAGASGGPLIITATYQSFLRVLLQGKSAWEAVTEPRVHHQLFPTTLFFENYTFGNITLALPLATQQLLASKGNILKSEGGPLGVTQVITINSTGFATGVSDPRKDGAPAAAAAA